MNKLLSCRSTWTPTGWKPGSKMKLLLPSTASPLKTSMATLPAQRAELDCFAIGSKGDAVGRLGGVDPCGHGLLAIVDENFDAVLIQQDAELERTVLAAHLALRR